MNVTIFSTVLDRMLLRNYYVLSSFISPIEVVVETQLKLALTTIKWSPKVALSGWNTLIKLSIGL